MTACPVCGKARGRTVPKTLNRTGRERLAALLAADPFCSTECCRTWHGVPLAGQPQKGSDPDLAWTTA